MHVPYTSPITTVANISGVDASLHQFVGISWHILMPYTILGGILMVYSQTRLMRGQHELAKTQLTKTKKSNKKKSKRWTKLWTPSKHQYPAYLGY